MEYRALGRSGLRVSEISLGSWLTYGRAVDDDTTRACILRAYELGINLFDTANAYHSGAAEASLGRVIRELPRASLVIATKVFFPMGEGPNDRGLSRKHVTEQCHASLRRLGTEYVDLYQCHRFDPTVPTDETLRALEDLVRAGKVLYLGGSEWSAAQIGDAVEMQEGMGWHRMISNQPQYSMLVRGIEAEVIPTSERVGVGQIVWSPLAQGVLTGKYRPGTPLPEGTRAADPTQNMYMEALLQPPVLEAVERLRPIADGAGVSIAQLALAWTLRLPNVASAIVGATRVEQVESNAAASGILLDDDTLARIDAALEGVIRR
ncbi:MAG TPA: aldo/keto reductase family protein [Longimicrobium sp.]|nr:aldo/keto reductase family protein [Longimicrobium sp.]